MPWFEDCLDGAGLFRKEDGDVRASGGCSLAQIMPQHYIQSIVPQGLGALSPTLLSGESEKDLIAEKDTEVKISI
jgi:hypothetical protein